MGGSHYLFAIGSLLLQGKLLKISTSQAMLLRPFSKKKLALFLLCLASCWMIIGCTHDKLSDEAEAEDPYVRIETYRRLIQEYEKYIVLPLAQAEASFNVEEKTYKELKNKYLQKFSLTYHPDKGGDAEKFKAGKEAWEALENKLISDGYNPEDLKKVTQGLLDYLQTHPTPR